MGEKERPLVKTGNQREGGGKKEVNNRNDVGVAGPWLEKYPASLLVASKGGFVGNNEWERTRGCQKGRELPLMVKLV